MFITLEIRQAGGNDPVAERLGVIRSATSIPAPGRSGREEPGEHFVIGHRGHRGGAAARRLHRVGVVLPLPEPDRLPALPDSKPASPVQSEVR